MTIKMDLDYETLPSGERLHHAEFDADTLEDLERQLYEEWLAGRDEPSFPYEPVEVCPATLQSLIVALRKRLLGDDAPAREYRRRR